MGTATAKRGHFGELSGEKVSFVERKSRQTVRAAAVERLSHQHMLNTGGDA